jgi:hypothetical protein
MVKNVYEGQASYSGRACEQISLLEACDYFIIRFGKLVKKKKRSPETLRKWHSHRNKVEAFIKFHFSKDDVRLWHLPNSMADDMLDFLMIEEDLCNNMAMKYVKDTKQVLTTARRKSGSKRIQWRALPASVSGSYPVLISVQESGF